VLQLSGSLRHIAETSKGISAGHQELKVLVLKSDGGGDHNFFCLSSIEVLLALAHVLDVDCLIAQLTATGQYYVNHVERMIYAQP
jgi:hypothetical protein